MTSLRPFQIVTLAIFAVLAILAVVLISGFESETKQQSKFGSRPSRPHPKVAPRPLILFSSCYF